MTSLKCACVAALVTLLAVPVSPQSGSTPAANSTRGATKSSSTSVAPALTQDIDSREYFTERARIAWRFGEQFYRSSSGLIAAVPFYDYATVWDLASGLSMLYGARELGFIDEAEYKRRVTLALDTIARLKLFDGVAFNKSYKVSTSAMIDRHHKPSTRGIGWSVTDLGRLLLWLRIIANRDPDLLPAAEAVVNKLDYSRLVKDGYLWGEDLAPDGKQRVYQEGQIGYEQYAAQGFAVWGHRAEKALNLKENEIPIEIMGQTVAADKRQRDRLTSEPFVLAGLEFGWSPDMQRLAKAVLAAQQERARRTGILTIVSEDALDVAPHYFYYYCVLANGREFSIDVQDPKAVVDKPRWMSTKAAFGWHALVPSDYTRRLVQAVEPAMGANGWSSGVYEKTTRSTGTLNVNTAAVVMTAAVYSLRREPLLARGGAVNVQDFAMRTHGHDYQSLPR
jgi:hypothetical protein